MQFLQSTEESVDWPSVEVLHTWRSCCNRLHAILSPAHVPLYVSQMSSSEARLFDNMSDGVLWLIEDLQFGFCRNHVS